MRAVPFLLVLGSVVLLLVPAVHAADPRPMNFNGQASSDVKGPVRSAAMDGAGRWGAVAVGDATTTVTLTEDEDLHVYNLNSQAVAWRASDKDLLNEGARLVAVANGTNGNAGDWLVLANATNDAILSAYRTGSLGSLVWQVNLQQGPINGLDINADGRLVAVATGGAAANKSFILLWNRFESQAPTQIAKLQVDGTATNISRFTSVAVSMNTTVPATASNASAFSIVGAETLLSGGLIRGQVMVFETTFLPDLDRPTTRKVLDIETSTPVTRVAITANGEYAVAGTQDGQVYLLSVSEALQRRGATGIQSQLRPWQVGLGSNITALDIAKFNGEFFAAGTDTGEVALFRNRFGPSGSEGAQAVQVARTSVGAPSCATPLSPPVASIAASDFGETFVVGAQDGLMALEAAAYARFPAGPLEPAWCLPIPRADVADGVRADVSGDGRRIFAASGHRAFGYESFRSLAVQADDLRKQGAPGQRVQWAITVQNTGSLFDRVNLSIQGPQDPGWDFSLSNQSLTLMPGKGQLVTLNVTSPPDLPPSNISLNFVATPERGGPQPLTTTLRLDLGQLRRVEIRPPTGTLIASAGTENRFPIVIHNGGNANDRFRVFAQIPAPETSFKSPGSEWIVRVDPIEVEVPANGDATVSLVVEPQAQRGDSATFEITVEPVVPAEDGQLLADARRVTVAVEPTFNADIALVDTREHRIEPGTTAYVNFTVKNLGNTRDIFKVQNRTEPGNAPGWKLQLSDERFELRTQNQQKVVRLAVFAQPGLQPGQSVRVLVELFSEGLQKQNPGSDGQVDSQSVTIQVVPKPKKGLLTPAPPEPLVLLAVLGAALLATRRRWA